MTQIHTYLTFNGNCREAMSFYKECLGGELKLQTIGESPLAAKMPDEMKDYVLHGTLEREGMLMMGSDMVGEQLVRGNSVSLSISCSSEDEIKNVYKKLSEGGRATHPLEDTFWGALFGDLTDKFGNHWVLNYNKNEIEQGTTRGLG